MKCIPTSQLLKACITEAELIVKLIRYDTIFHKNDSQCNLAQMKSKTIES